MLRKKEKEKDFEKKESKKENELEKKRKSKQNLQKRKKERRRREKLYMKKKCFVSNNFTKPGERKYQRILIKENENVLEQDLHP